MFLGLVAVGVLVLTGISWERIVAWYELRVLFESLGRNVQGYDEYRHRQTGIVMVSSRGLVRYGPPRERAGA